MGTNTLVLIIVTAMAALVLAGALVVVVNKTRTSQRRVTGTTIRDQDEKNALRLQRQQVLADEFDARAHAAQVEIDIKTVRASSLQRQAKFHRDEAVTSRDQLDVLTAATHASAAHPKS